TRSPPRPRRRATGRRRPARSVAHPPAAPPSPRPLRSDRSPTVCALVAVVVGLVRAVDADAEVGRLVGRELGQPDPERVEMQARDLLVQLLGKGVDPGLVLADRVTEQLD